MKGRVLSALVITSLTVLTLAIASLGAHASPPSPVSNTVLSTPDSDSAAQGAVTGLPTDSFTVEGFVFFPTTAYGVPSRGFALFLHEDCCAVTMDTGAPYSSGYAVDCGVATGDPGWFSGVRAYVNTGPAWRHVACTYDHLTGQNTLYVDGESRFSSDLMTWKRTPTPPDALIGGFVAPDAAFFDYFADEVRVSSAVRYSSNFTPPDTAFDPDSSTSALWHFDEPAGSTTFYDALGNNLTLTGYNGALTVTSGSGVCGDGTLDPPEECDDGNTLPCDGCSPDCETVPDSDGDGIDDLCECCDISGDGFVNTVDARLIQRCAVGEDLPGICGNELCDCTGEGECNTIDARLVQRLAVGELTKDDLHCSAKDEPIGPMTTAACGLGFELGVLIPLLVCLSRKRSGKL